MSTRTALKAMFVTVEVNLVLWLAALGTAMAQDAKPGNLTAVLATGLGFSVIVQHWAYYAVYKKAKQME